MGRNTLKVLYDGDEILYQSCSAAEEELAVGDHHVIYASFTSALNIFEHKLEQVKAEIIQKFNRAVEIEFAFSGFADQNFRLKEMSSYKSHRKKTRKPMCFGRLRRYIEQKFQYYSQPNLEADDVMGLMSDVVDVLVSSDKDMGTLPNIPVYSPYHGTWHRARSTEEADWYWIYQTIVGDRVDNYPGIKNIGDKKAKELLSRVTGNSADGVPYILDYDKAWTITLRAFEKSGEGLSSMISNARCARILRPGEFEYQLTSPILWTWTP